MFGADLPAFCGVLLVLLEQDGFNFVQVVNHRFEDLRTILNSLPFGIPECSVARTACSSSGKDLLMLPCDKICCKPWFFKV